MRSVFVHLIGVTRDAVCARLSEFADSTGDEWRFPRGSMSHTLEIGFYHDLELESEPEDLEALRASLGQLPDLIVYANISGRIPGDTEARQFVTFLLRHYRGVAWDDYTPHCWTLAEIESDHHVLGHPFFDYAEWDRAKHDMAESQIVHCTTHGERRPTFVCRHLVRGAGLGFFQGRPLSDEDSTEQCAWCNECEEVRIKCGGGWTDASEGFAGVTMICDECFEAARLRNSRPNANRAWWKFW